MSKWRFFSFLLIGVLCQLTLCEKSESIAFHDTTDVGKGAKKPWMFGRDAPNAPWVNGKWSRDVKTIPSWHKESKREQGIIPWLNIGREARELRPWKFMKRPRETSNTFPWRYGYWGAKRSTNVPWMNGFWGAKRSTNVPWMNGFWGAKRSTNVPWMNGFWGAKRSPNVPWINGFWGAKRSTNVPWMNGFWGAKRSTYVPWMNGFWGAKRNIEESRPWMPSKRQPWFGYFNKRVVTSPWLWRREDDTDDDDLIRPWLQLKKIKRNLHRITKKSTHLPWYDKLKRSAPVDFPWEWYEFYTNHYSKREDIPYF